MKKDRKKIRISIILITAGILLCAIPLIGQQYTKYKERQMLEEWLNSEESYSQLNDVFSEEAMVNPGESGDPADAPAGDEGGGSAGASSGNTAEITPDVTAGPSAGTNPTPSPKKTASAASKQQKTDQVVLGVIQIDKIKVNLPIVEGVSSSNLKAGIGHIPGTASIGQPGNCALAGHRSYTFGRFFNRLDELEIGDVFILKTKDREYKYKVFEKKVVLPSDVSVLKGNKKENIATLITCTPIYVASHRLIIQGRLEES